MITIIAKFRVIGSKVDEFERRAVDVTRESRKERGNLSYKIYRSRTDKTKFTFVEEWLNDAVIEQHNSSKHFKEFLLAIKPLTEGAPEIEQLSKVPSVFH